MNGVMPLSKAKLSHLRKLLQKRHRQGMKLFIAEGGRIVGEALSSDWKVQLVVATQTFLDHESNKRLVEEARRAAPVFSLNERDFETIAETVHSQGIIAVVEQKPSSVSILRNLRKGIVIAVEGISDPGNLGTIIRTADWYGVSAILVDKESVEVFNPKVVRGTMGSIFRIPLVLSENMKVELEGLRRNGFSIYTTAVSGGQNVQQIKWDSSVVLVLGSEARGVSREIRPMADEAVSIPRFGRAESLNVGVACGVILSLIRANERPVS
jgi:TrmH family RNA methyltransferase